MVVRSMHRHYALLLGEILALPATKALCPEPPMCGMPNLSPHIFGLAPRSDARSLSRSTYICAGSVFGFGCIVARLFS